MNLKNPHDCLEVIKTEVKKYYNTYGKFPISIKVPGELYKHCSKVTYYTTIGTEHVAFHHDRIEYYFGMKPVKIYYVFS